MADFPVPHGREEEWRFTPLERLRGLHDGTAVATDGAVKVAIGTPDGVTVETVGRDDERLGRAGTPWTAWPRRPTRPSTRPPS